MTAERHENEYDGDAYDGMDALMAAITDEPLPEAARADAGFMAEHALATAEVALLREQLGLIGEALSAPPAPSVPEPVISARPVRRRRPALRVLAYGTLATAAVATTITGLAWLVAHNGVSGDAASSSADRGRRPAPARRRTRHRRPRARCPTRSCTWPAPVSSSRGR